MNIVVTPDIEDKLSELTGQQKNASRSLSKFILDLDKEEYYNLRFVKNLYHQDVLNYLFVNFNYTCLLDNYINMDGEEFDPQGKLTVPRNFTISAKRKKYDNKYREFKSGGSDYSCYLNTTVIHPQGQ